MKLTDFDVLTFDCYGTLIDWENGILQTLKTLTDLASQPMSRDRILEDFAAEEVAQETETPDMVYSEVLTHVHQRLEKRWGIETSSEVARTFGQSVGKWPAFADSASALMYLAKYYKLVILSNVDRASFAQSSERLMVTFDGVYTAQDIGSYKPNSRNFAYMIDHVKQDFGVDKNRILHVAQSLYHDHEPARAHGLANVWIDRRYDQDGWGATKAPASRPQVDWHFHSMADLAAAHQQALREV